MQSTLYAAPRAGFRQPDRAAAARDGGRQRRRAPHCGHRARPGVRSVERPARLSRALAIVRGLAIGDAAYFLVVLATTLHAPAPIPAPLIGDAVCRAHRCIAVVSVDRVAITDAAPAAPSAPAPTPSTAAAHASVAVTLRLSNTSRYASHDVWPRRVFVVDGRGVRYPLDATEAPLTERLDAGELRTTIRRFTLPSTARPVGFLVESRPTARDPDRPCAA